MKSVPMLLMLPLADQGESMQNFTPLCRPIIEVQNISGKVQFKAWKSPHLLWTPLFLVGISEGLQGQQDDFGNHKESDWKKLQGQILNSFKRRI